ncbi:hypothetical protein D0T25_20445 [Duganella sp. BJB488]|uniref:sugar transferase n=1 Tax=unclassified Duganella TaxID=2636909 RepID=UPI000E3450A1|nr:MULTISPECIES: sugar transferase [unclassified Duganella]RFP15478.1 hypothetical protein D0T26_21250 [Duganella sp. BJB489]RFP20034.1 hypothetical protein D0T25_20445 [Duganella sp. BJB488]RFP38423.1 hypothetical protein D0T24_02200 [Duganella sp. BJB480]
MLAKRLFDVAAALAGLVLLAPLLLLLAVWIKCDSPGPVLFRQRRVGRHGRPFDIRKFRTMAPSAEETGQLSLADDARATRAGRLLRRHKLDELPQLLNVLLGQMSLVGPRPEVSRYVAHYPPAARALVLSVPPGITDWAAIRFRDEGEILRRAADPEQAYLQQVLPIKLEYYLRYVRERSFGGDLRIVFCTLAVLLAPAARLRLLARSRLTPRDQPSPWIALLRGLAALQVAAAHLRAQVFPGLRTLEHPPLWYQALAFATGFAQLAVVLFFVLSGWLVGGSLLDRHGRPHALRDYGIDRLTRLWIVLLPAFALMLLLGLADGTLAASADVGGGQPWSLLTLLGNLAGVQTLAVPAFGGNFPLWSLANETWYYALFPLLLLAARGATVRVRAGAAVAALAIASRLPPVMLLYFTLWLLGAGASRLRWDAGPWGRRACVAGTIGVAVWLRLRGPDGDLSTATWLPHLLFGALALLCLCSLERGAPPRRWLAAAGAFLASFSFTLYVVHIPLQQMLWTYRGGAPLSPRQPASLAVYAAMLAVVVALAYLFHLPFEAQTARLRRRIRRWLAERGGEPATPPAPQPDV